LKSSRGNGATVGQVVVENRVVRTGWHQARGDPAASRKLNKTIY
jgi:hypothetical protein